MEFIGENAPDVNVTWSPNNQVAATYVKGVDFDRKEVNFLGFNGENMKSMTVEGRGFQSQWSTQGDKLLYSVYSTATDLKPKLWLASTVDGNIGGQTQGITLNTWASKCTFANDDEVYCAVPKDLQEGAGLFPADVPSLAGAFRGAFASRIRMAACRTAAIRGSSCGTSTLVSIRVSEAM